MYKTDANGIMPFLCRNKESTMIISAHTIIYIISFIHVSVISTATITIVNKSSGMMT